METPNPSSSNFFQRLMKFTKNEIIVLLIIISIGFACIYTSHEMEGDKMKDHLHLFGHILLIGGSMELIKKVIDKNGLKDELKKLIEEHVPNINAVKVTIDQSIQQHFPSQFVRMRDHYGLIKIDNIFDIHKVIVKLRKAKNSSVRILKIFIPFSAELLEAIRQAIYNNCTVQIILCSPEATEALARRCKYLPMGCVDYKREIEMNLRALASLYQKLPAELKGNLKVREHHSFISCAIFAIGDEMWVGKYLHKKYSTDSSILRIKGTNTVLYQEYTDHFMTDWEDTISNKDVDLSKYGLTPPLKLNEN